MGSQLHHNHAHKHRRVQKSIRHQRLLPLHRRCNEAHQFPIKTTFTQNFQSITLHLLSDFGIFVHNIRKIQTLLTLSFPNLWRAIRPFVAHWCKTFWTSKRPKPEILVLRRIGLPAFDHLTCMSALYVKLGRFSKNKNVPFSIQFEGLECWTDFWKT